MIAFPSSPSDGQVFSVGPRSWVYNEAQDAWILNRGGPTGPTGPVGEQGPAGVLLTNITVDQFIGDGITTNFTLSVTPISAFNLIVNVDGLVQTANINYVVVGQVLQFAAAPIANATIDAMHLQTGSAITGPAGTPGPAGPTGPRRGETGPTGPAGSSVVSTPLTSVGSPGDVQGRLAFSPFYFYYCTGTYDGITNIWRRVAWDGTSW